MRFQGMVDPAGFKRYRRELPAHESVQQRLRHWREYTSIFSDDAASRQGGRCMDCGIPFCHQGCPVDNLIPDWNDLIHRRQWRRASEMLHSTNNFPEITGRICPAPCEEACTLNLNNDPVTIKAIEHAIADRAWDEEWVLPQPSRTKTGKKVAIVGSGPAGLACAQQLVRVGHAVTIFEKWDRIGGLLRYGIPDFRLEKPILDRRLAQMQAEGVSFRTKTHIGVSLPAQNLLETFDVVALACGAEQPRDLLVPGRQLDGIHFAMPYLIQQNRRMAGYKIPKQEKIWAGGKHVVIIGGGDTGSDCVGTANRQGARSVTQIQYHETPPKDVDKLTTWPEWPQKMHTSDSHEEGCNRLWGLGTMRFTGKDGRVSEIELIRLKWKKKKNGTWDTKPIAGSEQSIPADLVLLAMGYANPVHAGLINELRLGRDARGNVLANASDFSTNVDRVFACGDMRIGQSWVVWAIREGRLAARAVDAYLMGESDLP